ncbi:unnamed protein product, partial [marine sediment metagenome]
MPDVMRWRNQDSYPVVSPPCQTTLLYEIGDLIFQSLNGQIYPASAQTDQGSLLRNQALFACRFLGVAAQRSEIGEILPIRVNTRGNHEFIIAAVAVELVLGTRVGAVENAAGAALLDQTVTDVAADNLSIGRVQARALVGDTSVLVRIVSEVMDGGLDPGTCESSSSV